MTGLYIPGPNGSAELVRFDCSADLEGAAPTVVAASYRLTFRNISAWAGDTSIRIAGSQNNNNNGIFLSCLSGLAGGSALILGIRTTQLNYFACESIQVDNPDAEFAVGLRADFINGIIEYFLNGSPWGTVDTMQAGDSWWGGAMRPYLRSRLALQKDIEWHEVAYWSNGNDTTPANINTFVPTAAQLQALTGGGSIGSAPATKSWIAPNGTNGAYAGTFNDLAAGGRTWSQTSGPTTGEQAPYFVGNESISAGPISASSQRVQFALNHGVSGTAHVIVGPADANPSGPLAAQIKAGVNQNGSTATDYAGPSVAGSGTALIDLVGTSASVQYKGFATIETDTDVFTPVVSWTFTAPRIGVKSDVNYVDEAAPALWANQVAVNASVAAEGVLPFIGTGETDAAGKLIVDLSEEEGFYLPVGAPVKLAWDKGVYFGSEPVLIENLDA